MFQRILLNIKQHSRQTLSAWCYQCESILAQRSRRIQQLFTFYHRVYGAQGLRQLLRSYHRQLEPPLRGLMLSAVGAVGLTLSSDKSSTFDWSTERLSLRIFEACLNDLDFINTLPENRLCPQCEEKCMKYCYCLVGNKKCKSDNGNFSIRNCLRKYEFPEVAVAGNATIQTSDESPWEPYFCKNEFSIWRRQERTQMFSYKVYARFDDITAADLLYVQTDLEYRKQWDDTAVRLEMVEPDPLPGTNSHLIYWEMRWPKLFCNRDYVYCRRYVWDDTRKVILIGSRGTTHPAYPLEPDKVRVKDYWSLMVIKPYHSFYEPGVHYMLTYYDDPGVPIPQNIKSWVTQKQMPDFLQKMYNATKQYACHDAVRMSNIMGKFQLLNNDYEGNKSRGS